MSAILSAPVSPCAPASFVSLFSNPEFRTALKGFVIDLVKEDIDFRESIREAVDYSVATSDLKILKRISTLESMLITDELNFDDEEHVPTIPERIKELSDRLEHPLNNPIESIKIELPVIPKTTLEHKASELVEHLKTNVKPRNGEVFLNSREIITFLKHEIKEEYQMKDIQNPRQAKKDIVEKAKKMFSDLISLDKKKHGNRDIRIVYKPKNDNGILNRMGTYIRS
jgi:hypothetical protein